MLSPEVMEKMQAPSKELVVLAELEEANKVLVGKGTSPWPCSHCESSGATHYLHLPINAF
jgi:hypothetical protein